MKKVLPTLIIIVLILSGIGAVAVQDKDIQEEIMIMSFSKLSMEEKENYAFIELEGADSLLVKKDHYVVPTKIETFTFPFGTEITDVKCTPKDIHKQTLTKELMISPDPVLSSQTFSEQNYEKSTKPAPSLIALLIGVLVLKVPSDAQHFVGIKPSIISIIA